MNTVRVQVPPLVLTVDLVFDCLGLALNLYNILALHLM